MTPIVYASSDNYPVALLIKGAAFVAGELERTYTEVLETKGVDRNDLILCPLNYNDKAKAPVKFIKAYLAVLMPALASVGVKHVYCADAAYFKTITKSSKAEPHLGYILKCALEGYEHMDVTLGVNHKSLIYNPANEPKLALSIDTLADLVGGTYKGLGADIIKHADYPATLKAIKAALAALHDHPGLVCDTETFSLHHDKAGLGTIGFSWSKHEGIAFACDYKPRDLTLKVDPEDGLFGDYVVNPEVRALVKEFLTEYKGELTYHGSTFDIKILIAALWMDDLLDTNGLLTGLEILTRSFQDTKIIAYLALNSCGSDKGYLGLKDLAHMFAGNWAQNDIKDIRKIPLPALLEYNLVDCLSTWYVKEKYYPKMVADNQEELYYKIMLPSQKTIIQIELTGMPLNPKNVRKAKQELEEIRGIQEDILDDSKIIKDLERKLTKVSWEKDYTDRRDKAKHPKNIKRKDFADYPKHVYNPNSPLQTQVLLYDLMGLPVIDKTDTGQPACGHDTLEKVVNHTENVEFKAVIHALMMWSKAEKILGTFIAAFERAIDKGDGVVWLHGNFNLGGTKSGRLSSSGPNLQNLPAGSVYGKLVKRCFEAPKGWIFAGADFNSLEDYISALTTRDPNKLKVYLEGYDGHCLRAYSYFPDRLPGIVDTVDSINSIKDLFPEVRQDSKAPTFLLTYGGTWMGMYKNLGFPKSQAKVIDGHYHNLYQVSDQWVQDRLDEASKTGYVTVAFGLRLRTPLLGSTIRGHRTTPYEAQSEGRTAGNALGQSYGLLNNRACNEFMEKVWASPYRFDIKPIALIHDAIYLLIRDNIDVIRWVNQELIKSMQWQELPELHHDTVKLGAELSLFWPTWADEAVLKNDSNEVQIRATVTLHREQLRDKEAA